MLLWSKFNALTDLILKTLILDLTQNSGIKAMPEEGLWEVLTTWGLSPLGDGWGQEAPQGAPLLQATVRCSPQLC